MTFARALSNVSTGNSDKHIKVATHRASLFGLVYIFTSAAGVGTAPKSWISIYFILALLSFFYIRLPASYCCPVVQTEHSPSGIWCAQSKKVL